MRQNCREGTAATALRTALMVAVGLFAAGTARPLWFEHNSSKGSGQIQFPFSWTCGGHEGAVHLHVSRTNPPSVLKAIPFLDLERERRFFFDAGRAGPLTPVRPASVVWSFLVELRGLDPALVRDFQIRGWNCPARSDQPVAVVILADGGEPAMDWQWDESPGADLNNRYRLVGTVRSASAEKVPAAGRVPPPRSADTVSSRKDPAGTKKAETTKPAKLGRQVVVASHAPVAATPPASTSQPGFVNPQPKTPSAKPEPVPEFTYHITGEAGEWLVVGDTCQDLSTSAGKVPAGYSLPDDDMLVGLSRFLLSPAGARVRAALPFLMQPDHVVWSSRGKSLLDQRFVVKLSDGSISTMVPDGCAYVVAKKVVP